MLSSSRRLATTMFLRRSLIHTVARAPAAAISGESPVLVYDTPEFKRKCDDCITCVRVCRAQRCQSARAQLHRGNNEERAPCSVLQLDTFLIIVFRDSTRSSTF